MTLITLFDEMCNDLAQGKTEVRVPPNEFVTVTEENGFKFFDFVANGIAFKGVFRGQRLWITLRDNELVVEMERDRLLRTSPVFSSFCH
jgi:hypothetical protein